MLGTDHGGAYELVMIFPACCFRHHQIIDPDRRGAFGKVPDGAAQRSLIDSFRNDCRHSHANCRQNLGT